MNQPWRNVLVTAALCCLTFTAPSLLANVSNVTLSSDSNLSTAGYFRLNWKLGDTQQQNLSSAKTVFELQQATQADFADAFTLYQGPDQATVISGLANNTYYYRVRIAGNPAWSEKLSVEVKHHSLARAFGFFGLGIVMFIITVTVLLKGTRLTSENSDTRHDNA